MKHLVVLNGQYFAGKNTKDNKLVFVPDRSKAVKVDEKQLRFIIDSIYEWFMAGEIELKRVEVLEG